MMSNREYAHTLLDRIPESRLAYIVYYLEGAAVPDEAETPNAETQEAFEELDNGGLQRTGRKSDQFVAGGRKCLK